MFRLVYTPDGMAVQIPDNSSDLKDFLAKGYRETPPALPPQPVAIEQEVLAEPEKDAPPPEKEAPAPDPVTLDPSMVYVNTATLPTLAAQLNISTTALRVLKNNRPFESFDQLNELVKLEGLDWTAFKDRLSFEQ